MIFLKTSGKMVLWIILCVSISLISGRVTAETPQKSALAIDSPQRQEIQAILDTLTGAPEVKSAVASRENVERYISVYRQKAALVEKELVQLETALQGVINKDQDTAVAANTALSELISLKQQKERELVELRLLIITGEEAVDQIDQYIRTQQTKDTYFRGEPLWRLLADSEVSPTPVSQRFDAEFVEIRSKLMFLTFLAALFLILAAVPSIRQFITNHSPDKNTVNILVTLISRSSTMAKFIFATVTALSVVMILAFFVFSDLPLLAMGIQVVFFYLVLRLLLQSIILRYQPAHSSGAHVLQHRQPGWILYAFSLATAVVSVSGSDYISEIVPILGFLLYCGWLLLFFLFCRQAATIFKFDSWKYLNVALLVTVLFLFLLEFLGYGNFNDHLAQMAGYTFVTFCLALIAYDSIDLLMALLRGAAELTVERFDLTPIKTEPTVRIHNFLGVGLKIYVIISAAVLIIHHWGIGDDNSGRLLNFFIEGSNIGGFTISPARITLGLFLFVLAWPAIEYLKQLMDRRWLARADMSNSARDTFLTLSGYAGYSAVILLALGVAGVRLTGLTVIIGALSVGIGFGLQNVVNNFISGLILMFERPIKKGDWILVGTTEGYVKKISIRSTIVQTFDRADVIVPNSELIANQVTNMMFDDQRGRLRVTVGVAYGSDTELVQRLLLEVAHAHEQVITDGSTPEPRALFQAFGDSSLNFDLLVHLHDIDVKIRVRSEIHTMIDKAFRQHGIEIPFPQRDIHIKNGLESSIEG